jgi:large subunit ribosomal protein L17
MRHRKHTAKLGRTSSHQRALFANQLKSLIDQEKIITTVPKAKELRRYADKIITLAKDNTLASKRTAIAKLQVRFNALTPKEARAAKDGDESALNVDRKVINKLFNVLGPRFANRQGGYTRIIKSHNRVGDNAQLCVIEYLSE